LAKIEEVSPKNLLSCREEGERASGGGGGKFKKKTSKGTPGKGGGGGGEKRNWKNRYSADRFDARAPKQISQPPGKSEP